MALSDEIAAYEGMAPDLEAERLGKWALVYDRQIQGFYETFEAAAGDAIKRFGRGPYLIRQVGSGAVTLPVSVMYQPVYANH